MHLGEPLPEPKPSEVQFNAGTLLLFFFLPFTMMMWTNGVGASTGMFVPALAVGATGNLPHELWKSSSGYSPRQIWLLRIEFKFRICLQ